MVLVLQPAVAIFFLSSLISCSFCDPIPKGSKSGRFATAAEEASNGRGSRLVFRLPEASREAPMVLRLPDHVSFRSGGLLCHTKFPHLGEYIGAMRSYMDVCINPSHDALLVYKNGHTRS